MINPMSNIPRVSIQRLWAFEPKREWFVRDPRGLHGIAHETRVLLWTQVLASMEGGAIDADALGWAAALHDTRRENDDIDDVHGALAADWLLANPWLLPQAMIDRVAYLCRWHSPSDNVVPSMTYELAVFKDADALDRWRFGEPDPNYFRTKSAPKLLSSSRNLALRSRSVPRDAAPFDHVISAAKEMGLLKDWRR